MVLSQRSSTLVSCAFKTPSPFVCLPIQASVEMKFLVVAPLGFLIMTQQAWTFTPSGALLVDRMPSSVLLTTCSCRDTRRLSSRIYMKNDDDNQSSSKEDGSIVPSKSNRRAGGRVRNKIRPPKKEPAPSPLPGWVKTILIPVTALWILSQLIFGGESSSSSNYYYYQSSVYQSSVYGPDGRVDTAKKESVRTKMPGLGPGQEQSRFPVKSNKDTSFWDYERRADEEFDRQLDQEIESMMRIQRNFLNEFW